MIWLRLCINGNGLKNVLMLKVSRNRMILIGMDSVSSLRSLKDVKVIIFFFLCW